MTVFLADFGNAKFPLVAGHEVIGTVARAGSGVTRFKVGDRVGVGPLSGSCFKKDCFECTHGLLSAVLAC